MYEGVVCGKTSEFPVITGLHKGSALSPYFFALIMDELSAHIHEKVH